MMAKYIFTKTAPQTKAGPDEIIVYAQTNKYALAKVEKVMLKEKQLLDAKGEFLHEVFRLIYSVRIERGSMDMELFYKQASSIFPYA